MPEQMNPGDPRHSEGFGPAEDSDATRQSQHSVSNDAPTDVNMNAIIARSQALTHDIAGKDFERDFARLNKIFDSLVITQLKGA